MKNLAEEFARAHAAGRTIPSAALEHRVLLQHWIESERGWGCRPDGCSLHLDEEQRDAFVKAYWARQPAGPAPEEYSRPAGSGTWVFVDTKTYNLVRSAKGSGLRSYQIPKHRPA